MMASSCNSYVAWTYTVLLLVSVVDFADLQSACSSAAVTASIPAALYCFNNEVVSAPRLILDAFEVKQSTSSECRCRVTSDMNTTVTLSAYQGMNAADDCDSTLMVNVGGTFNVINCFISGSYLVDGDELVLIFIKPVYNYNADYCISMTPDNSAKLTIKCDGDPLPSTPITQLSTTLLSTSTTAQSTTLKATTTSVAATTTMSSPPISSTSSMTSTETSPLRTTVISTSTNSPTTQQQTSIQTISTHDSTTLKQATVQTISSSTSTTQKQTTVPTTNTQDLTSKLQTDVASVSPSEDTTTSHQMSTTPLKVTTTAMMSSTTSSASSSRPLSVSSFTSSLSTTGDGISNAQTTQTTPVSSSEQYVTALPTSTFSKTFTGDTTESSVVSTTKTESTTVSSKISTTTPRRFTTSSKTDVSNTNDEIEWSWVIPLIGGGIIIIIGIIIGCCYCYSLLRKENSKPPESELQDGYQDKAFINYAYDAVEGPEFTSQVNNAFLVDEPVNHSNTKSKLPDINTIILEDSKEDNSDSSNQTRGSFIRYSVKEYPQTQLYASVNKPTNQRVPVNTVVNEPTTVYGGVIKSNNTDVPMYATVDKLNNRTGPTYTSANNLNKGLDIYY